jgi:WD40-like Beta Propeller Repeat
MTGRMQPRERTMNRRTIPLAGLGVTAVAIVAIVLLTSSPSDVVAPGSSGTPSPTSSAQSSPRSSSPSSAAPSVELLAPLGYNAAGTIVFVREDSQLGGDAVFTVDPDGTGETEFRPADAWNGDPISAQPAGCCAVISPDGTQIAVAYEDSSGAAGPGTWLMTRIVDLSGTHLNSLPSFCGGCRSIQQRNAVPRAWSPDGSLLASEMYDDGYQHGMAIVPTGGWTDWVFPGGEFLQSDVPVAFSPDGTELLFVRLTDGDRGTLMVLTVPGLSDISESPGLVIPAAVREVGTPGMLTTIDSYFGAPASWSPDGQQIVFAATDPSSVTRSMRIWVVGANGGDPVALTEARSVYTGAAWSPDGEWIAFDSGDFGPHDLFLIRADGSGKTNVTESFSPGICCARWSPDSTALLAAGTVGANDESYLFIVPIDGSPVAQVTTVPGFYQDFSWGPASR